MICILRWNIFKDAFYSFRQIFRNILIRYVCIIISRKKYLFDYSQNSEVIRNKTKRNLSTKFVTMNGVNYIRGIMRVFLFVGLDLNHYKWRSYIQSLYGPLQKSFVLVHRFRWKDRSNEESFSQRRSRSS